MGGMGGMGRTSGTMPPTMGMMMLARMIMYFCGDPDSWDMRSLMIGMMGGMGGGMGGGGGMMGGMGGMGRTSGTMPPTLGMMMLARMIMYFCGDPDSWDMRSLMIGMMGGMGGGMGMMGGGMGGMGGMGGGMGGMRSVPPTDLPPSALLGPGQTRNLPTRLVSLTPPDPEAGLVLPEKEEPLQLMDIAQTEHDARAQKALRRLAADMAPTSLSQLVMWRLAGLDWKTIGQFASKWAKNKTALEALRYELTLAKDFVDRLDSLSEGETGRILFEVAGSDEASKAMASGFGKVLDGKTVLGLVAQVTEIPESPTGPTVACRVRMSADEAMVQVFSSDACAQNWVPFGKFTVPVAQEKGKLDEIRFADGLAEGVLNRLVRAQVAKGTSKEKGKRIYQVRIENASPLVLNGVALVGTTSPPEEKPKPVWGICISPRGSLTVPATEEVVKTLGLRNGIKLTALNLSGL
jgi:hypothetical protein